MNYTASIFALCTALVTNFAQAHDQTTCHTINTTAPGAIAFQSSCTDIQAILKKSGQFPDVFAGQAFLLPGLGSVCFASTSSIDAKIDNKPVKVTSLSTFTNDTKPILFPVPGYTDNIATVITQLSIFDLQGKLYGSFYTRDVIDASKLVSNQSTTEVNAIVGGSKFFEGAKGSLRIESLNNVNPFVIPITTLKGSFCNSDDE